MSHVSSITYVVLLFLTPSLVSSGPVIVRSIQPNFTASNFEFIDQSGDFLISENSTFKAAIHNLKGKDPTSYYFSVKHVASDAVVWSANPSRPISSSDVLSLTSAGLSLPRRVWSTPALPSAVYAVILLDSGDLRLVAADGRVLWRSFDNPTDTLVPGQLLRYGKTLAPARAEYRLALTRRDAVLLWRGVPYWKLSMEAGAFRDSNAPVSYMSVNASGIFLLAADESTAVVKLGFERSSPVGLSALRLGGDGRVGVGGELFSAPAESCRVPMWCGTLQVCDATSCFCPSGFVQKPDGSCFPANTSLSLPSSSSSSACDGDRGSVRYVGLGDGVDYFANDFTEPSGESLDLLGCQDLCSRNCSCFAVFHHSPSGSCYLVAAGKFGSLLRASKNRSGYIKAVAVSSKDQADIRFKHMRLVMLPLAALIFVSGVALLVVMIWARKRRAEKDEDEDEDEEAMSIPGLPVRYAYEELAEATGDFGCRIGSGGFGTVYKGTLGDGTAVAVKKINNSEAGARGKRDFCTEVSIIGNVHHANLVRLKGFCVQGNRPRLLVMEFMDRGSLDRALFSADGPVLEWPERLEIALGTARGLAYLHEGCDRKIIHCDVKPENILLQRRGGSRAKLSDFGLSKLAAEDSSLFTTMRGTRGYLAPEWLANSPVTEKADVYSYGMVLLEIVSGERNSTGSAYFPVTAVEMHERGRWSELADRRLEGRVVEGEVSMAVKIALCCAHEDPALRPAMASVVGMLEGVVPITEPLSESLNFLRFYGRRFAESTSQKEDFVMWTSDKATSSAYISSHQLSAPR